MLGLQYAISKLAPKMNISRHKHIKTKPIVHIPKQSESHKTGVTKMGREKQYWLLKTEAGEWSWEDQAANGGLSKWDGVKNKQAQKNLKSMRLGDLCFFYHSGNRARRVVGVVSVVREWYEDDEDDGGGGGGAVDVRAVGEMRRPVDLKEMKGDGGLKGFGLFRQPRLSVVPVPEDMWDRICEIGGGFGEEDGGEGGGDSQADD
ncbi:uncharacterized protein LOC132286056 [Cornus florida]|uniref:uncharacterized protein LOC132286056 n=1 Tax=Cornus florida TaxID=4283 RepID=UPI00289EC566|nr:uncharacterized protein LOC132286056 [Cornus florida]